MTGRVVEPEWLDKLPPDEPRAQRSRSDLVRVNALMGNPGIVARELRRVGHARTIAEIGAGDGTLLARVLGAIEGVRGARVMLVDRHPAVREETVAVMASDGLRTRVIRTDVFDWLTGPSTPHCDVIVANLFLHHFGEEALGRLLARIAAKTRFFIACEPRRSRMALAGARLLGLAGCNDVTRHDAVVSVRAGFVDGELTALWPREEGWALEERARGLFSHAFVAERIHDA